ncbi:MAG: pantoate--beta-alanine ligase [Fimbriimonas sp.]
MKVVQTIGGMANPPGARVGFVPTMGAFHEGHLQLMRRAREENDHVVVSIFVNPTQFGKNEDFSRYPRNLDRDVEMAASVGVDVVFAPEADEMYPGLPTLIQVPELTERWEGASRPGHFDGVATVVLKLFNIVRADTAYFGQKDLQQCLVIRRMVRDLNVPTGLSFEPTVREADGLAMSSRNIYLSPEERQIAPLLRHTLRSIEESLAKVPADSPELTAIVEQGKASLQHAGFEVDYLALVDLDDLQPGRDPQRPAALVVAAKLGRTRLIDNLILHGDRLN